MRRIAAAVLALLCVLGAGVTLAFGASRESAARPAAAHAAGQKKKRITAHLRHIAVSVAGPDSVGCGEAFFAEVPEVRGAASYVVNLKDTKLGDRSVAGPPFATDVYGVPIAVGKGTHLIGLTSGSGPKCTGNIFGTLNQRFKVKSAYAIVDSQARVTGTVRNAKGDPAGGVVVKVGKLSGTTDGSGYYSVEVEDGTYAVRAAKGFCVVSQGTSCRASTSVTVKDTAAQVDFRERHYSISGTVRRSCASGSTSCSAKGVAGVSLGAKSDKNVQIYAATNSKGRYTVDGVTKGTWVLTPVKQGTAMDPASRSVRIGSSDKAGVDFSGCDTGATAALRDPLAHAAAAKDVRFSGTGLSAAGQPQEFSVDVACAGKGRLDVSWELRDAACGRSRHISLQTGLTGAFDLPIRVVGGLTAGGHFAGVVQRSGDAVTGVTITAAEGTLNLSEGGSCHADITQPVVLGPS